MNACFFRRYGGPGVLEYGELPDPVPGAGEVLIEVHAASVASTAFSPLGTATELAFERNNQDAGEARTPAVTNRTAIVTRTTTQAWSSRGRDRDIAGRPTSAFIRLRCRRKDETGVGSAEAEGVRHRVRHRHG